MTASIDNERRQRALRAHAPGDDEVGRPHRLITAVRVVAIGAGLAGVGSLAAAFCLQEWRTALSGVILITMATVASGLLVVDTLVADRRAFYERGRVDGWMSCWRGEMPSAEDPLLRD